MYFWSLLKESRKLKKNEKLSRAELEQAKLVKFRRLVNYINQHSPYYQKIISEHRIDINRCVPADFPILSKADVVDNFDELVTDRCLTKSKISDFLSNSKDPNKMLLNRYQVVHTSGSSGQIAYYVFSETEWCRGAAQGPRISRRFLQMRGGRLRYAYVGAVGGHFAGVSMAYLANRPILNWRINLQPFEVNQPMDSLVAGLNAFKPDVISGYTTALCMLAQEQRNGNLKMDLLGITTGGEPQTPAQTQLLSETFACPALNSYGCSEHLVMGGSDPITGHMHIFDDDLMIEFNPDGIVVTNLFNYTQPLIRYQMSDVLRPIDDPSVAPYLVVESVVGRFELSPTFINRDGREDYLNPISIVELYIAGAARFQFHLLPGNRFEFLLCLDGTVESNAVIANATRELQILLTQKHMDNVEFSVSIVNDLPVDKKTGKFRLVVDRRH